MMKGILESAAKKMLATASTIKPLKNDNGFNERNMVFYLLLELYLKGYHIYHELPVKRDGKWIDRFDSIAFSKNYNECILIEAKQLWSLDQYRSIVADYNRLRSPEILDAVDEVTVNKIKNKKILILCDAWSKPIVEWWNGEKEKDKWDRKLIQNLKCGSIYVGKYPGVKREKPNDHDYHWLYGIQEI